MLVQEEASYQQDEISINVYNEVVILGRLREVSYSHPVVTTCDQVVGATYGRASFKDSYLQQREAGDGHEGKECGQPGGKAEHSDDAYPAGQRRRIHQEGSETVNEKGGGEIKILGSFNVQKKGIYCEICFSFFQDSQKAIPGAV